RPNSSSRRFKRSIPPTKVLANSREDWKRNAAKLRNSHAVSFADSRSVSRRLDGLVFGSPNAGRSRDASSRPAFARLRRRTTREGSRLRNLYPARNGIGG